MVRITRPVAFALCPVVVALLVLMADAAADAAPAFDAAALAERRALAVAVEHVAPAVVQIRTIGGLEQVDDTVLAQGPTSGTVIRSDGYIVSSAFNFAQQPSSILVRLPDGSQRPAEIVGRDHNRMLVLLKVDADQPLPVPTARPLDTIRVGQRVAAVGRTFVAEQINVSAGVVSALGRMEGRVLQTDAKASAANYGGPLVDLSGRVLGVLVPMAPQMPGAAEQASEVAGVEYYDSGIAFAVPWQHIANSLPRWIDEGDLHRGLLGIGLKKGPPHATPPEVTSIWPRSPAAEAGWQAGDLITAVDGEPVESQTQLRMRVAPHYAGDAVSVTLQRGEGDEATQLQTDVVLADKLPPFRQAFLGILPASPSADSDQQRSQGVTVRAVWPDSPAAAQGVRAGDRVIRIGDDEVADVKSAVEALAAHSAGDGVELAVQRDGEEVVVELETEPLPNEVLSRSELGRTVADAEENEEEPSETERALDDFKLPEFPHVARGLAPRSSTRPPGMLIWLGSADADENERFARSWTEIVDRDQVVLVVVEPADDAGWSGADLEYLSRMLPVAASRFGADPRRTVLGGEGKSGQLAQALALRSRGQVAGVAAIAAPLPRTLTVAENAPGAPLAVLTIATQNSPFSVLVNRDARRLLEAGYPVTQATRPGTAARDGRLSSTTRELIARWLDGLDRL